MKGSIRKTGENKWRLVFDLDRGIDGKRRQKVVRFSGNKKEAEKNLRDVIKEYEEGNYIDPSEQTLGEFLDYWLDMVKGAVELKTFERYQQMARVNIKPVLGSIKVQRLETRHLDEAYALLLNEGRHDGDGGLAPKTIRNIHGVLSMALKKAVAWKMILTNPAAEVTLPKVERQEVKVLTKERSADLLASCEGRWLHPIVFTALMTGMRRGEIAALRWRNVNLKDGWIRVAASIEVTRGGRREKDVKTKHSRRRISLPPVAVDYLEQHKSREAEKRLRLGSGLDGDAYVFTTDDCRMRAPELISEEFAKLAKKQKIDITFHGLRHTHISQLLADGHPITTVSRRAGHAATSITLDIYGHVMPDSQERMMEEFGAEYEVELERARNKAAESCDQSVTKQRFTGAKSLTNMVTPAGLEPALPG